jgi:hypothetical protein
MMNDVEIIHLDGRHSLMQHEWILMELKEMLLDERFLGRMFNGSFYIHGEVKFSLWVDGEIAETVKFPAPGPFVAVALDECGTISISYMN